MTDLAAGTVTFLFTDIEGSTRLWERDAAAMQAALDRHDEILHDSIEGHGGHVFKTVGDAFCAVFASAPDALEAALEAQRILLAQDWSTIDPLRVRMALHAGTANERGGDYFGPSLNRVARLVSAAHGGQVLLSVVMYGLLGDRIPELVEFRDLGERRFKDLFQPERIFQLVAPDLPPNFPPLKTLDERLNNLPIQPTPLVGREREVAEVGGLLRDEGVRLLTLTGPGGTGKTLVGPTIARALDAREAGERPSDEALQDHLRDRQMLLVLDNFEQVVEAAPLVGELLAGCPGLKVLATSRSALRIYGEREYPVPAMRLPDPRRLPPIDELSGYEAIGLFVERAGSVKGGFRITEQNAPAVAGICIRLDGLPLAIELAAARVRLLPPEKILQRLEGNRLKILAGGARDLPERQQTLRGAIEWSYALLQEDERTLFARLAVFSGGCTLEAMEEICDTEDALEEAESLLDKSLIRREEPERGEPRFAMLETIHEYSRERLRERTDAEATCRRHAEYFLTLAEETEPVSGGLEQVAWFGRLEAENDNLRAAISWAIGHGEAELGLQLAQTLRPFWYARGHYVEGRGWVARFLGDLGELFVDAEDYAQAQYLYEEVLVLSRQMDDAPTLVDCLIQLSHISLFQRDHQKAMTLGEEAAVLSRNRGYGANLARALNCLGWATLLGGDHERAAHWYEQSLAMYKEPGDKMIAAESLEGLACVAGARGESRLSARLFGAVEAAGFGHAPGQRALREPYLAAAATWQAAYAEGRSTSVDSTIYRAGKDHKLGRMVQAPEHHADGSTE